MVPATALMVLMSKWAHRAFRLSCSAASCDRARNETCMSPASVLCICAKHRRLTEWSRYLSLLWSRDLQTQPSRLIPRSTHALASWCCSAVSGGGGSGRGGRATLGLRSVSPSSGSPPPKLRSSRLHAAISRSRLARMGVGSACFYIVSHRAHRLAISEFSASYSACAQM